MSTFWSVFRTEFNMSIRRRGLWLAYGILFVFYFATIIAGRVQADAIPQTRPEMWTDCAQLSFLFNLFLPVVAGILAADRLIRDRTCRMDELLHSTPLRPAVHLLAKYLGVTASLAAPVLVCLLTVRAYTLTLGAPFEMVWMTLATFFAINLPAYTFVTAFSLVCPLFMPVRVYQVLFTGYWFWGNYLSPDVIPTLSGTLLQAGGKVAMEGWFGISYGGPMPFGPIDVVWNLLLLAVCIAAALSAGLFRLHRDALAA
jgi:ABC-2 type transport system permease protein